MTEAAIKPIQTRYKGYHFRSRLEARWAVFFDALGMSWEYEPQGFDLGGTHYLPDFRISSDDGLVRWYEIKPKGSTDLSKFDQFADLLYEAHEERNKAGDYSESFRADLVSGDPYDNFFDQGAVFCPRCWEPLSIQNCWGQTGDDGFAFSCHTCDMETESGGGNPWRKGFANIPYTPHKGLILAKQSDYIEGIARIDAACIQSRSARFEHGECGAS